MWVHVIAVIALALACGIWTLPMLRGGGESGGVEGDCAACASRRDRADDGGAGRC